MSESAPDIAVGQSPPEHGHEHHVRQALEDSKRHLRRSALEVVGYLVFAYLLVRLVPTLTLALHSLTRVSWVWVIGAVALELVSELGFVFAWRAIVDPDKKLEEEGRGNRMADRVAWAQLGSGVVAGGAYGGMGVGGWILHRFGMPLELIARRQFNLQFLNTTVSALALIVFGVGLAVGVFEGESSLALTLVPAALAVLGVAAVLAIALHAASYAERLHDKRPKVAATIGTLANAVEDTKRLVVQRGHRATLLAAIVYLGFEVLVLWSAFLAVHARPIPGFAVVMMAYVIGALGGSIPLPAALGTVAGIAGMLIAYGVDHNPAVAAVLLHQAIALLVPFVGGTIAYALLRHRFGPLHNRRSEASTQDASK